MQTCGSPDLLGKAESGAQRMKIDEKSDFLLLVPSSGYSDNTSFFLDRCVRCPKTASHPFQAEFRTKLK